MTLAAVVEAVARYQPDRIAIDAPDRRMSYAAMVEKAARLAGYFRETCGIAPGGRIAIFTENHAEFYPVLLAAWHAGLAAVPVNAKLHAKELAWIVADCRAALLLTSSKLASTLSDAGDVAWPRILVLDAPEYTRACSSDPIPLHDVRPSDEAWLFYTSGTTGRPKGAMLSHRSILFMCHAYYADIDMLGPDDTALHAAPLSHGSGLYGLANMLRGGCNVILPGFDPRSVLDAIATNAHVSMFAAPTMITRLLADPTLPSADLGNLKTITYGGAPMYVADLKRALERFGPRLYQLYGQGESPMTITGLSKAMHADHDHPRYEQRLASAGVARTGVRFDIVRDDGTPCACGEVGEIITTSDCLMTGYWNAPEANFKAMRAGWLWTGDLGSKDEDGFLTIKDRSKDMIISGGTNIYPREIEEVLLLHPAVAEVAVVGRPHPDWGEEAVAYVVARPATPVSAGELDALCLENIARFKRPKDYVFVDDLPKNNYGKILKTELRSRS